MQVRRSKTVKQPMGKLAAPAVGREVPKYIIIGLVTLLAAGLVSYATIFVLQQLQAMEIEMGQGTAQAVLIGVFLATAIALFIPLMRRFGPPLKQKGKPETPVQAENPAAVPQDLLQPPPLEYDVSADANAEEDEAEKETEETEAEEEEIEDSKEEAVEELVPAVAVTGEVERDLLKIH